MRKKLYISFCGLPDSGKSTLIKNFVKHVTLRDVAVDSLCDEEVKEMTIRSAQIFCRIPNSDYDIVFLDCPGHLELREEIKSCLSKSQILLFISDQKNHTEEENRAYIEEIRKIRSEITNETVKKLNVINVYSHSSSKRQGHYDINDFASSDEEIKQKETTLESISQFILDKIETFWRRSLVESRNKNIPDLVDPETTARRIISEMMSVAKNPGAMISYGKDSIVMLSIAKDLGYHKKIHWCYPVSGFDMDGLSEDFIRKVNEKFDVEVEPYRVIPDDIGNWNFESKTVQEMMLKKAEMLNEKIAAEKFDYVMMGIRRDEEGVRAKEKFFSIRKNDGSADLYEQQYEEFGNEIGVVHSLVNFSEEHVRVHPLLDVSEADAWLYIKDHELPFCSEYVSKNGYRYRSLGDKPITTPIPSYATTIDEIVKEVTWTLVPERSCRAKQDAAVKGNMETIRSKGFF